MPTAVLATLWATGACLESYFLGSVIANVVSSIVYDQTKTRLADFQSIISRLDQPGLPANAELVVLAHDSLAAACVLVADCLGNELGEKQPFVPAILEHWRNGTLFNQPLVEARNTPQHRWLRLFRKLIADGKTKELDTYGKLGNEISTVLQSSTAAIDVSEEVNRRLRAWVAKNVPETSDIKQPDAFEKGLHLGFSVDKANARVNLYSIWCLFFREGVKREPKAFAAFVIAALGDLGGAIKGLTVPTAEEIALLVVDRLPTITFLEQRFDALDTAVAQLQSSVAELGDARAKSLSKPVAPQPVQDFVGRDAEINDVVASYRQSGILRTGFWAHGGCGKTELVRKIAHLIESDFPDGTIEVDLNGTEVPSTDIAEAQLKVLRELFGPQSRLPADAKAVGELYHYELSRKRLLIILDNAASVEQLQQLLPRAQSGVLVTSRCDLAAGDIVLRSLGDLREPDAIALACKIAPAIDIVLATKLVLECGLLAEAIRVVASTIRTMSAISPADHFERFRIQKLAMLPTVVAAYRGSLAALSPQQITSWGMLGVFPKTFDLNAAHAVIGESEGINLAECEAMLATFVNLGILRLSSDPPAARFALHDLARTFARSQLDEAGLFFASRRHAMYFTNFLIGVAMVIDQRLRNANQESAMPLLLSRCDDERENLLAAHRFLAENVKTDDECAKHAAVLVTGPPISILTLRLPSYELAEWARVAVTAYTTLRDEKGIGYTRNVLGCALLSAGSVVDGTKELEAAKEMGERLGDDELVCLSLSNLANAWSDSGKVRKSVRLYAKVARIRRGAGDIASYSLQVSNLGNALARLGKYRFASVFHSIRLRYAESISDEVAIAWALQKLTGTLLQLSERKRAKILSFQLMRIAKALAAPDLLAFAFQRLSECAVRTPSRAEKWRSCACEIEISRGDSRSASFSFSRLSQFARERQDPSNALKYAAAAVGAAEECSDLRARLEGLTQLLHLKVDKNDQSNILELLTECRNLAHETDHPNAESFRLMVENLIVLRDQTKPI